MRAFGNQHFNTTIYSEIMYTWPGTPFNGDRYKFEEYLEVLTQQLRANNCLKIAKNEEEPQQQQQQGGNSTNASLSSNSTSTRSTINAVISSTTTVPPTTADLQNTHLKIAEHERKSELGLAIICMSVIPIMSSKINKLTNVTCPIAYNYLKSTYGSKLTVAEMTYIDQLIEKKMENETAENYIENFKSLHKRSGMVGSPEDNTRMLARLLKNFKRDNLFVDSRKLAYFTDKGFDETVELIIKEDEINRATKGFKEDSNRVSFQDNTEPNIPTILRVNSNYEDNNIEASNPLKQNTMQNSKRNFNNTRENNPSSNKNNNYGNNKRNNYNNDNSNKVYDNSRQNNNNNNYNNNNKSNYDNNRNNNDKRNREKSPSRQNFQNHTRSKSAEKHQSSDNNNKRQKFTHDETIQNRANIKCRNLAKGFCNYGDNCNFSHSK